jgi:Fe-S-cluster-containing dehydrogenase component
MAIACLLCEKPACVSACPTGALFRDKKGVIHVNEYKCTGCSWCIQACKFGAITLHPTKKIVMTCDLCDGDPECVKLCPFEGALTFATIEEITHKLRKGVFDRIQLERGATDTESNK